MCRYTSIRDLFVSFRYVLEKQDDIEVLSIDNVEVREGQVRRLAEVRAARDGDRAKAALEALTQGASGEDANCLALAVECARARCTVEEISEAMAKVFGRHVATDRLVSGAYR